MASTITLNGTFVTETCCHDGCHVTFAMSDELYRARRNDHGWFYCPNGHRMRYASESDLERAQREARVAADALARERARHDQTRADRDHQVRRVAAANGRVTRIKNRVVAGVCPCCNRTFENLARHMASKHPKYAEADRG